MIFLFILRNKFEVCTFCYINRQLHHEEVHTPKGRSLDNQLRNVGARLKCLVEGLIELGGFIVLRGKEKIGKSTFWSRIRLLA